MSRPAIRATVNPSLEDEVQSTLKWLKSHSTRATRDGMARYAIPSEHALGAAMKDIKALGKKLGRNHELAAVRGAGPLVQGLRQLGDLRHALLQSVRPHASRLGEGHAVEQEARRVREARCLRAAVESCAA